MKLVRFLRDKDLTLGRWTTDENNEYYTVERPWLDNKRNVSCIPDGNYTVKRVNSPKFGERMWEIADVSGRSHILVHVANYPFNVEGCVGMGMGVFPDLSGVSRSKEAIENFYEETRHLEEFPLTIITGALS
jgi:hypothetical protein